MALTRIKGGRAYQRPSERIKNTWRNCGPITFPLPWSLILSEQEKGRKQKLLGGSPTALRTFRGKPPTPSP
jgi:hypothetical protein